MEKHRRLASRLFIIAGNASSGKDKIISAVRELGSIHAQIVTKYTTRQETDEDGSEIVCRVRKNGKLNPVFQKNFEKCDISYDRNGNTYRIDSSGIWDAMKSGLFQVVSVTEADPINQLKTKFGSAVVLIYVHSDSVVPPEELSLFVNNFDKFDHVLIYENSYEDLYDQLFRLFRAYEKGFIK
jgi:guanylate kinase